MPDPTRVSPSYVRQRMASGAPTLLVCAYDDPAKCREIRIAGSLDMKELEARRASLTREREIVFYCT